MLYRYSCTWIRTFITISNGCAAHYLLRLLRPVVLVCPTPHAAVMLPAWSGGITERLSHVTQRWKMQPSGPSANPDFHLLQGRSPTEPTVRNTHQLQIPTPHLENRWPSMISEQHVPNIRCSKLQTALLVSIIITLSPDRRQRLVLSIGPIWVYSTWRRTLTMDNVQNFDSYINIPSSQTYR
jgi:hypothetical protein